MGRMTTPPPASETSETAGAHAAPDAAAADRPARRGRKPGNWRSLVLSMAAVGALVFVLYAIVPRPSAVTQPAVDVKPVAAQVHEDGHTAQVPALTEPWKSSVARYRPTPQGPTAFYVGYVRTDSDDVFVAVQQIPTSTPRAAADAWLTDAISGGVRGEDITVYGRIWHSYAPNGDPKRRALVADIDGMTTVLSGLATRETLVEVARSLKPYRP